MSSSTDIELMDRVRDGDIRQLGELYTRHHMKLFNFFLRLTGERQSSEDMTQEVFFRMLKYRHTFRGEGEFSAWMYHLARNVRMDHFRKSKNEALMDGHTEEMATGEPHPHEQMEKKERSSLVRMALARLPDDKREILILSRYQDLRYDAIAELLGCSVDAVKVRVHRAVSELRTIFLELSGEGK